MATYVMTLGFTSQGIQQIKEGLAQMEAAKKAIRSLGGEVKAVYGILGAEYDVMLILEAPDDEAVGKMALAIGLQGNFRTTTHRAFSEEGYRRIVSGLP